MEHLTTVQLAEYLEDAGDLAAGLGLGPRLAGAVKEGAQVSVARLLERQAVEEAAIRRA